MSKVRELIDKGVDIPCPESVMVGDEVDVSRISGDGVVVYPGCKILGASTLILQGAKIGNEAPATVDSCQVGPQVQLKGGFFQGAVFLKKASMGSGAHVREGTILEEQASGAHTVGLKQTILFPFVTLGSLINFCDIFMSGGTSRKNHSEVGSSYIHFNYTPNQDKATPSLLGDVPRGVMLDRPPIFLGGQGGLVGPCVLSFGTVAAAGSIVRKDETREGRLLATGYQRNVNIPYFPSAFANLRRIYENNILYLGNLFALKQWYAHARARFVSPEFPEELLQGLKTNIDIAIAERIKRLKAFFENLPDEKQRQGQRPSEIFAFVQRVIKRWDDLDHLFQSRQQSNQFSDIRDPFLEALGRAIQDRGKDYISVVQHLSQGPSETGTRWLEKIVEATVFGGAEIVS